MFTQFCVSTDTAKFNSSSPSPRSSIRVPLTQTETHEGAAATLQKGGKEESQDEPDSESSEVPAHT